MAGEHPAWHVGLPVRALLGVYHGATPEPPADGAWRRTGTGSRRKRTWSWAELARRDSSPAFQNPHLPTRVCNSDLQRWKERDLRGHLVLEAHAECPPHSACPSLRGGAGALPAPRAVGRATRPPQWARGSLHPTLPGRWESPSLRLNAVRDRSYVAPAVPEPPRRGGKGHRIPNTR